MRLFATYFELSIAQLFSFEEDTNDDLYAGLWL